MPLRNWRWALRSARWRLLARRGVDSGGLIGCHCNVAGGCLTPTIRNIAPSFLSHWASNLLSDEPDQDPVDIFTRCRP
jgi:hypothetical protein